MKKNNNPEGGEAVTVRGWWEALLNLIFPPRGGCPLCGRPEELGKEPVCLLCRRELASLWEGYGPCPCCGKQVPRGAGLCGDCRREGRPFARARALGPYQGKLREAIHRLKFGGVTSLGEPLGKLLAQRVEEEFEGTVFHLVVPVPLHPSKLRERGFNQAEVIARALGDKLGVPVAAGALRRLRDTDAQARLSREERWANLAGAFAGEGREVGGKRILLVDDVFTTGATASQGTLALLQAGAREVMVATVATGRLFDGK